VSIECQDVQLAAVVCLVMIAFNDWFLFMQGFTLTTETARVQL